MTKRISLLSALLLFLQALTYSHAHAQVPLPSSFWGYLTVNGRPVPVGTRVSAWINGVEYAHAFAQAYQSQSTYSLNVPGDDPTTPLVKEGGVYGDVIHFKLGSLDAPETGTWIQGTNVRIDLTTTVDHVYVDDNYDSSTTNWGMERFDSIQGGVDTVAAPGTVTVYAGTYNETLNLNRSAISVQIDGDIILNGNLTIANGQFAAPLGTLSHNGNFALSGGSFNHRNGVWMLTGTGTHTLSGDPTFYDLTIASGLRVESTGNVSVAHNLTLNSGSVVWETRNVTAVGPITFNLTQATIDVTSLGSLSSLTIERHESNHPQATSRIQTGRYWKITPTGSSYTADLTLWHNNLSEPRLCKYTAGPGYGWDCAVTSFTASTATRTGITSFSDWAVGDNVGPTAISLVSLGASSGLLSPWREAVWLLAALFFAGLVYILWKLSPRTRYR